MEQLCNTNKMVKIIQFYFLFFIFYFYKRHIITAQQLAQRIHVDDMII